MPKILIVGDWQWPWYQEACARALRILGCSVGGFGSFEHFKQWAPNRTEPIYRSFARAVQYRFLQGPAISALNRELLNQALAEQPDIIWFYNVQVITVDTVIQLRRKLPRTTFCQYANDNPFSRAARKTTWRHFLASIPHFHLHYCYRQSNFVDYERRGARQVYLLRSYFIPEDDAPIEPAHIEERFTCDVVFAGHYENDGRLEVLEEICRAGFKLNLFGGGLEWSAASTLTAESTTSALSDFARNWR